MAIINKIDNSYIKLIIDEASNHYIVNYSIYLSTEDRNKEKQAKPLVDAFLDNIQITLNNLYDSLMQRVNELGLTEEDYATIEEINACLERDSELKKRYDSYHIIYIQNHNLRLFLGKYIPEFPNIPDLFLLDPNMTESILRNSIPPD